MSQHKHPGLTKGPDYKKLQHPGGFHVLIYPPVMTPGTRFKMQDGRVYEVQKDGSFRRYGVEERP